MNIHHSISLARVALGVAVGVLLLAVTAIVLI